MLACASIYVCLPVCMQRWIENYWINFHQFHTNISIRPIIDALRFQLIISREVSKAADRTLAEGDRDHRPSWDWVSMPFVFTLTSLTIIEKTWITIPLQRRTKSVKMIVPVPGTVYLVILTQSKVFNLKIY